MIPIGKEERKQKVFEVAVTPNFLKLSKVISVEYQEPQSQTGLIITIKQTAITTKVLSKVHYSPPAINPNTMIKFK